MIGDAEIFMPFSSRADNVSGAKEIGEQSAALLQPGSCFKPSGVMFWDTLFNLTCDPQLLKSTAESASLPCQV